jgi:hypothetical protein
LVFTAYALGLVRSERWNELHKLFGVVIGSKYGEPRPLVDLLFLWTWKGAQSNAWKLCEDVQDRHTPLSDHLLALFEDWGESFVGLVSDFDLLFERYELLGSLAHFGENNQAQIQALRDTSDPLVMPIGRAGWRGSDAVKLFLEIQTEPMKSALLKAGFANGESDVLELFVENFKRIAGRRWW